MNIKRLLLCAFLLFICYLVMIYLQKITIIESYCGGHGICRGRGRVFNYPMCNN